MALELHYQSCFKSKDGNTYAVNLYEDGYVGNIVQLTPAETPFVTKEDVNDNIFTAIRPQSGYIRIIDTDNAVFDQIVPPNNTYLLVRVYKGTYTGTWPNGVFTASSAEGSLVWQGFVQSQVYTQPWTEHESILELPVKSMLGVLKEVDFPTGGESILSFRQLLLLTNQTLFGDSDIWNAFAIKSDFAQQLVYFWNYYAIQPALLYNESYINENNVSVVEPRGVSFFEVFERISKMFGLCFREQGATLIILQVSSIENLKIIDGDWEDLENSTIPSLQEQDIVISPLNVDFMDTHSSKSIIPGTKDVAVKFSVNDSSGMSIQFPNAPEDGSATYNKSLGLDYNKTVEIGGLTFNPNYMIICQPHEQNRNSTLYLYNEIVHNTVTVEGEIWEKIFQTSIFGELLKWINPSTGQGAASGMLSGAIPVRYATYYYHEHQPSGLLQQGLLMNLFPSNSTDETTRRSAADPAIFTLKSSAQTLNQGYINLNFNIHGLTYIYQNGYYTVNDAISDDWKNCQIELKFMLKVGSWYWNGTDWQNSQAFFVLTFNPCEIPENYNTTTDVEDVGGFYIPVNSGLSGVVEFSFCDYICCKVKNNLNIWNVENTYTVIVDNFILQFVSKRSVTATSSTTNTYRKNNIAEGFNGTKEVLLDFGTFNNNAGGINFLKDSTGSNIETVTYTIPSQEEQAVVQTDIRPEIRLLNLLQNYFRKVRYTYTALFRASVDWMRTVITFKSRCFFGFIQQKDWKNGEEKIKLIETYNPNED